MLETILGLAIIGVCAKIKWDKSGGSVDGLRDDFEKDKARMIKARQRQIKSKDEITSIKKA